MKKHLEKLSKIVNECEEKIEGNCYTYDLKNEPARELKSKQENLSLFSKNCSMILEIGFGAGHSSLFFLHHNSSVKVVSIDIGLHSYSYACYDYLKESYGDRIEVIFMDSMNISSNSYLQSFQFDGLHIDGSTQNKMYIYDLLNSLHLIKNGALVIFDDTQNKEIELFMEKCKSSVLFKVPNLSFQTTKMYKHEILQYIKPRIKIVSLAFGDEYRQTWKYGIESKHLYCQKWNYHFVDEDQHLDKDRPVAWSKIKLVEREMNEFTDFVIWLDADTWIMNQRHTIEEFLLCMPKDKWLMLGEDVSKNINSGVFFIKNCDESKLFLKDVYQQTQFMNHCWWEQQAIIHIFSKYKDFVQKIPREYIRLFNAYDKMTDTEYYYKDGDFLVHLPGRKKQIFKYNHISKYRKMYPENQTWSLLTSYLSSSS